MLAAFRPPDMEAAIMIVFIFAMPIAPLPQKRVSRVGPESKLFNKRMTQVTH